MTPAMGRGYQVQNFDQEGIKHVLLLAAGTGIAPIRAAIESDVLGLDKVGPADTKHTLILVVDSRRGVGWQRGVFGSVGMRRPAALSRPPSLPFSLPPFLDGRWNRIRNDEVAIWSVFLHHFPSFTSLPLPSPTLVVSSLPSDVSLLASLLRSPLASLPPVHREIS